MPYYLVQAAYTPEAWAAMVKNPQNRAEAIRPMIEKLGGKLHGFWFAFGEHDAVIIGELPDNVNVAAVALAASASGALKSIKTTPLMTVEEGMEAMAKASEAGYQPPTKKPAYVTA
jgi:uncharacterized protein with GYD domain